MDEIRIETTNKKTPFARWNISRKAATSYSEDPKFRMGGKDISIKKVTNEAARDCNIYEVIEKYRGDLKMSQAELNQFHTELSAELSEIKSMPDALKQIKKAEEAWRNLPTDIRKDFGNSVNNFIKNGTSYLNDKIKKYNDLQLELKRKEEQKIENINQIQIKKTNEGVKVNG